MCLYTIHMQMFVGMHVDIVWRPSIGTLEEVWRWRRGATNCQHLFELNNGYIVCRRHPIWFFWGSKKGFRRARRSESDSIESA